MRPLQLRPELLKERVLAKFFFPPPRNFFFFQLKFLSPIQRSLHGKVCSRIHMVSSPYSKFSDGVARRGTANSSGQTGAWRGQNNLR